MRHLLLFTIAFIASSFVSAHAQSSVHKLGWKVVHTPMAVGPSDVFYPSEDTIYCQSTKGNWESTDAGNTWRLLPPLTRDGELVTAFTGNTICAFWNNISYRSTDEGRTWDSSTVDFAWPSPAPAISRDTGILTSFGYIARTTDQGRHWVKTATPKQEFGGVNFCNGTIGLVGAGTSGGMRCMLTDDAGATWDTVVIPESSLTAAPAGRDTLVYVHQALSRSTDRGTTWTRIRPSTQGRYALRFHDATGLLAGGWGYILRTTDAGYTWDSIYAGEYMWDEVAIEKGGLSNQFIVTSEGSDTANVVLIGLDAGASLAVGDAPEARQETAVVFPNPASSHASMMIHSERQRVASVRIVDLLGREVAPVRTLHLVEGDNMIELPSGLANGQYHCLISGSANLSVDFTVSR